MTLICKYGSILLSSYGCNMFTGLQVLSHEKIDRLYCHQLILILQVLLLCCEKRFTRFMDFRFLYFEHTISYVMTGPILLCCEKRSNAYETQLSPNYVKKLIQLCYVKTSINYVKTCSTFLCQNKSKIMSKQFQLCYVKTDPTYRIYVHLCYRIYVQLCYRIHVQFISGSILISLKLTQVTIHHIIQYNTYKHNHFPNIEKLLHSNTYVATNANTGNRTNTIDKFKK